MLTAAICLWRVALSVGQDTATVRLQGVEVVASRVDLSSVGKHTDRLDSTAWKDRYAPDLATLLALQTPLFVRSYGSGSLATLGIRGSSSAHTQVLWNGVPLRNPMLGLTDLALIPSGLLDHASVHYGGHGAAFGSGAMGGLVDIGSRIRRDADRIEVSGAAGSWGTWIGGIRLDYGSRTLRLSTRYVYQHADNDYKYRINRDLPPRVQVHHALDHHAFWQEALLGLGRAGEIKAGVWYQYADRQIPPTSVQNISRSAQQDENLRALLQWRKEAGSGSWELRTAYLDERIDFQDSLILLYTTNRFRTWIAEASTLQVVGERLRLSGGLYVEHVIASSANYLRDRERGQQAAYASARLRTGKWIWRAQVREERTARSWSPLLWDLGMEWEVTERISVKSSLSRNYRVPTINDLSWRPGGNPDLLPESGYSWEAGIALQQVAGSNTWKGSLTGYAREVHDWILWLPPVPDVRDYWSPVNIAKVRARGLETRLGYGHRFGRLGVAIDLGMDLTWSTLSEPVSDLGLSKGDQMLYVPVENVLANLQLELRGFFLVYRHHWFGSAPGINEAIRAGDVGTANLGYRIRGGRVDGSVYLQVDNVWDVPYRYIERRPMPGRGWRLGVRCGWNARNRNAGSNE